MSSREWRCSWSSADRRCSNYIWVIDNTIAYYGAAYIRDFTVVCKAGQGNIWKNILRKIDFWHLNCLSSQFSPASTKVMQIQCINNGVASFLYWASWDRYRARINSFRSIQFQFKLDSGFFNSIQFQFKSDSESFNSIPIQFIFFQFQFNSIQILCTVINKSIR